MVQFKVDSDYLNFAILLCNNLFKFFRKDVFDLLRKFYRRDFYENISCNFECYFTYDDSMVMTKAVTSSSSEKTQKKSRRETNMTIITECELPEFYGAIETARFCRKNILIIQGIITFFTAAVVTVHECSKMEVGLETYEDEKNDTYLKIDGVDYTADLKKLLKKLEENPSTVIALLDRWRKALYLESMSDETDLFHDEIALNFFQIMELLANSLGDDFKNRLSEKADTFLKDYYRDCYMTEIQSKEMARSVKKSVEKLLQKDSDVLSKKIKYFLDCHGLLDPNVCDFVDDVVKIRNSVAHGREIVQKNFMWPLPTFFNLLKDSCEVLGVLKALVSVMIERYMGTNRWFNEWQTMKQCLPPSKITMEKFFNNNFSREIINSVSLIKGNEFNVTWESLFDFYVKNPESKILKKIERVLKNEFLNTILDEENAGDLFNISIILADSSDDAIRSKAIANVEEIISKRLYDWANFKDVLGYLEFHSVPVKWYREFLENMRY